MLIGVNLDWVVTYDDHKDVPVDIDDFGLCVLVILVFILGP